MLMIFDLLTSPQGHQFDTRMKMLLTFCSARHPRRFDMLHDYVWKKLFDPLGTPQGGGGTLIFSAYVGSDPASTIHPKKYQEFQAPQKNIWNLSNPKKYPNSVLWP